MSIEIIQLDEPKHGVYVEELAQLHHDEFGKTRAFDVDAVVHACVQCVADAKRLWLNCWIALDTRSGEPVGYLAGTIRPSFYSFSRYACQEMWYVIPRMRGKLVGIYLLREFEDWALRHQCERIYTCVEHDDDPDMVMSTLQLMNKLGYKTQGYMAVKYTERKKADDPGTRSELGAAEAAQ